MGRVALAVLVLLSSVGCSKLCEPGAARCLATGTAEREVCSEGGDAWEALPCDSGEVCAVVSGATGCSPAACPAGGYRCEGGVREVCAEDRLGYVASPCRDDEACVTRDVLSTDDGCEPRVCTPGRMACKGTGVTSERELCHETGTRWFPKTCPDSDVCVPVTALEAECRKGVCTVDRCSTDRKAVVLCQEFGTKEFTNPCPTGQACASTVSCKPVICAAGTARCTAGVGGNQREQCDPSGTTWVAETCAMGMVCSPAGACARAICAAGQKKCSDGGTQVVQCDATGTTWVPTACSPTEACVAGVCKGGATPVGDAAAFGPGSFDLLPGQYRMAVVDLDPSGREQLPYPVSLSGDFASPLPGEAMDAADLERPLPLDLGGRHNPFKELTEAARQGVLRPHGDAVLESEWRAIGDTRTFRVLGDAGEVLQRTGRLVGTGTLVNLWEDQTVKKAGANLLPSLIAPLIAALDQTVLPRGKAIYASNPDVDKNGRFDVLFTDLLPRGGAAAFVSSITLYNTGGQYDYGDVAYCRPLVSSSELASIASTLGHENAHLLEFYRRAAPYLASGSLPAWVASAIYIHEGAAELAENWGGYSEPWVVELALGDPTRLSLSALEVTDYLDDQYDSGASYGLGSLVAEYAFDQAGAIQIAQPGTVIDRGGRAWIEAFLSRPDEVERMAPTDGRPAAQWWPDFATALLFSTLEGKLSASALANKRLHFPKAVKDPDHPGWLGAALRYENLPGSKRTGPILRVDPWASHPATLRRGGLGFVSFRVAEKGARLTVSRSSTVVRVVRLPE